MKKILVVFLITISIVSGSTIAAFAENGIKNDKLEQSIFLSKSNNGTFVASDRKNADINAKMTKDYGIYSSESGDLFSYTGTNVYLAVEKIEVLLSNKVAVENA